MIKKHHQSRCVYGVACRLAGVLIISVIATGCLTGTASVPPEMSVSGPNLPMPAPCRIYTPPDWDGITQLPLIILLHDHNENSLVFERHGVPSALFTMMDAGSIPPALLAVPESENGFWWNYYDRSRRYADFIARDLIPAVAKNYPVQRTSRSLHIFGIGTGAMGAVELAALYPGFFATVGALNGQYFDAGGAAQYVQENPWRNFEKVFGPMTNERAMNAHSVYHLIRKATDVPGTRFVLGNSAMGSWDLIESNELFRQHLFQQDIPHDVIEFFGSQRQDSIWAIIPVFISLQLGAGDTYGEINGNPYHVFKSR